MNVTALPYVCYRLLSSKPSNSASAQTANRIQKSSQKLLRSCQMTAKIVRFVQSVLCLRAQLQIVVSQPDEAAQCLGDIEFVVVDEIRPFEVAKLECQNRGGFLGAITSQEEQDLVLQPVR